MTDIATLWSPAEGRGDWAISGADLQSGDDLVTAVLVSLFTDAAARPDDVIPDGTTDPRGWWGDLGEDVPIGSRLWLLDRSKATAEVLLKARDYIIEALQWLVDDGVVESFDIATEWTTPTMLGARVVAHKGDATLTWVWQGF
ncbi:MAG TPA: phage GP46 family protein [Patescibacteria group bacterium]|nr:phage GP46 family protein [Patescibacteria group bacterium]